MAAPQLNAALIRLGFSNTAAALLTDHDKENVQIDALK
jgi:hypothetical protein